MREPKPRIGAKVKKNKHQELATEDAAIGP